MAQSRLLYFILCAGLLVASCSEGDFSDDVADAGLQPQLGQDELLDFDQAPPFQAALIEGGVTFSEYEEAFFAVVQCARERGIPVDDPVLAPDGLQYTTNFYAPPGSEGDAGLALASDVWVGCEVDFISFVAPKYIEGLILAEERQADELTAVRSCLSGNGLDIDEEADREDIRDAVAPVPEIASLCVPPGFLDEAD